MFKESNFISLNSSEMVITNSKVYVSIDTAREASETLSFSFHKNKIF